MGKLSTLCKTFEPQGTLLRDLKLRRRPLTPLLTLLSLFLLVTSSSRSRTNTLVGIKNSSPAGKQRRRLTKFAPSLWAVETSRVGRMRRRVAAPPKHFITTSGSLTSGQISRGPSYGPCTYPPRRSSFFGNCLQGRLPTRDRLHKIFPDISPICPLCHIQGN